MTIAKSEIGDLVLDALAAALEHDEPCALQTSGKLKGLLPGGPTTAAKKQAIQQCQAAEYGLFTIKESQQGKRKVQLATITRQGIDLLFERRLPSERQQLLDKCANPYKEMAHEAMLRVTEKELKQVQVQRNVLDHRASELREFAKKLVEDQLAALDQARDNLDRQREALNLLASGLTNPKASPTQPIREQAPSAGPATDGDIDFQQHLCRELVFAWQDNPDPEIRIALEPAMMNAGLERVGEVDETVPFDNRYHRTDSDMMPNQPAIVVETGWQLVSPRGTLLIAPIQVIAKPHAGRTAHASDAQH